MANDSVSEASNLAEIRWALRALTQGDGLKRRDLHRTGALNPALCNLWHVDPERDSAEAILGIVSHQVGRLISKLPSEQERIIAAICFNLQKADGSFYEGNLTERQERLANRSDLRVREDRNGPSLRTVRRKLEAIINDFCRDLVRNPPGPVPDDLLAPHRGKHGPLSTQEESPNGKESVPGWQKAPDSTAELDLLPPNIRRGGFRRVYVSAFVCATVLVVAGAIYVMHSDGKALDSTPLVSPLRVDGVTPLRHVDTREQNYALPSAARMNSSQLSAFNHDIFAKPDFFHQWLMHRHAVVEGSGFTNVTLTNVSGAEIRITGVTVLRQCAAPLSGTAFSNPATHGEDPGVPWLIDIDSTDPQVQTFESAPPGKTKKPIETNYFAQNTLKFKSRESINVTMSAGVETHYCSFRFQVLIATPRGQATKTIDDNGKPFEITAYAKQYRVAYYKDQHPGSLWVLDDPKRVH